MRRSRSSQALFCSACCGDGLRASEALAEGGDPNACNRDGLTSLMVAAAGGHGGVVELLLRGGASPTAGPTPHGHTALALAAARGDARLVHRLLQARADPAQGAQFGTAPLTSAAAAGHADVCRILLLVSVQVDVCDRQDVVPVMKSIDRGWTEVTKLLLEARAKVDRIDRFGKSLLTRAFDKMIAAPPSSTVAGPTCFSQVEYHADLCRLLASLCADVDIIDNAGDTLLVKAIRHRRLDVARCLLNLGATLDHPVPSLRGATALSLAASDPGCHELCVLLAERFASLGAVGGDGRAALARAAARGTAPLVQYLLDAGASPLDPGAAPHALAPSRMPLALSAADAGCGTVVVRRLLKAGDVVTAVPRGYSSCDGVAPKLFEDKADSEEDDDSL